jgi:hypothetical protein
MRAGFNQYSTQQWVGYTSGYFNEQVLGTFKHIKTFNSIKGINIVNPLHIIEVNI